MLRPLLLPFLVLAAPACLYSGEGTRGLPCNTDLECGGDQLCVEHVCGGPAAAGTTGDAGSGSGDSSSGGDPSAPGGDDQDVRTMCEASETQCVGDNTLRECGSDGKLRTMDCEGICGYASRSRGCHTLPDGRDGCYCLNAWESCSEADEGQVQCDGNNIRECHEGLWLASDCDSICIDAGYAGGSDHCGAGNSGSPTCFCLSTASECIDGAVYCSGDASMRYCSGGSWYTDDCQTSCQNAGYEFSPGCMYFPGDTEACGCQ